jgi:hypothetical protein
MANARDQMKMIDAELERIAADIERLIAQRDVLNLLKNKMGGVQEPVAKVRKRSPNVKPLVLDVMAQAGVTGATSNDVDAAVRTRIPTVADDTVASVLSRLKSLGALVYVGDRYYEKRFAPRPTAFFDGSLKAVI